MKPTIKSFILLSALVIVCQGADSFKTVTGRRAPKRKSENTSQEDPKLYQLSLQIEEADFKMADAQERLDDALNEIDEINLSLLDETDPSEREIGMKRKQVLWNTVAVEYDQIFNATVQTEELLKQKASVKRSKKGKKT